MAWWSRRSLRFRVSAAATVFVATALIIAGWGLVYGVHTAVLDSVDAAAEQRAADVVSLAATGRLPAVLPAAAESVTVVQVLTARGVVVASSEELPATRSVFPFPLPADLEGANPATLTDLPIPDGRSEHRVVALPATTRSGPLTVIAASSLAELDVVVASLITGLLFGIPALVAVVALATWTLAGYTLRSVDVLRRRAADITASDLHQRLPLPAAHDEIHALTATLNAMLARLDAAAATQRGFVADAAHELRSPLTAIRAQLDVARAHPDTIDAAQLHGLLDEDLTRLDRLTNDLLVLARGDDPSWNRRRPVVLDLDDIVLFERRHLAATGRAQVDATGVSAGRVRGDPGALRHAVRNLLDNATRYGDHVRITLRGGGQQIVLVVADNGPGVPPEDRDRVFDRFARVDTDRSRDGGGVGLGLAIVAQVVHAHHGTITLDQDDAPPGGLGGARFTLRLPAATDPDAAPPH